MSAAKIKKGDKVVVLSGQDKGKRGEVLVALPKEGKVIVAGVNMVKRHVKPGQGQAGRIDSREAAIPASKVAIQDPETGQPTRVGFKVLEDGRKVRFAKKSGKNIDG
jgi:large subunit ribosomal protein L24